MGKSLGKTDKFENKKRISGKQQKNKKANKEFKNIKNVSIDDMRHYEEE